MEDAIAVFYEDRETLIELSGEVDLACHDDLACMAATAIARGGPITVDVSDVTFMDSAGVTFLARLCGAEHQCGRRLSVNGARGIVLQLLEGAGLADDVVDVSVAAGR